MTKKQSLDEFEKELTRGGGFFSWVFNILGVLVLLFVLWIFLKPFVIIDPGRAGILVRLGKVVSVLEPGIHLKYPFFDKVVVYSTRLLTYETSDAPAESRADYRDYPVDTTTKDGQPIHIKYTVRFRIDPARLRDVYEQIGDEERIVERIVKTDSRVNVRVLAREFTAQDLYSGNVAAFEQRVADVLKQTFGQKGIILDFFGVRGIDFSKDYVDAVERKQIEKERVLAEKYKAEQEEYRKQAKITRAQAEAEAQRLLQKSLTKPVLYRMWIEKWNGELPQFVGGNAQFMIDLKSLEK